MSKNKNRPDQDGSHRKPFDRNKKKILATQDVCGICGKPVDKSLKFPHPMSPTIDHIIPIAKGGHPSDLDNLQLAHYVCNMAKSDNIDRKNNSDRSSEVVVNRDLPKTFNWNNFKKI